MDKYYISDLHFGHFNVIRMDNRPFTTLEDMENSMVSNWNLVVKSCDIVHILGDFCWGKTNDWIRILDRLNGQKILIKGNHDLKQFSKELSNKFLDIKDYKEVQDNGKKVILCHYPLMFFKHNNDENVIHLYGHLHNTKEFTYMEKTKISLKTETDHLCQFYNVGANLPYMNYTPKTLEQIISDYDKWKNV